MAITPAKGLELFANYGQGFRSIDVPTELIGNRGLQPFKIVSTEGGGQHTFYRFRFLATYWTTDFAERLFQATLGAPVVFLGRTRREGFDLDGRYYVVKQGNIQSRYSPITAGSRANLDTSFTQYSPPVPKYVANVGIDFDIATVNAQGSPARPMSRLSARSS